MQYLVLLPITVSPSSPEVSLMFKGDITVLDDSNLNTSLHLSLPPTPLRMVYDGNVKPIGSLLCSWFHAAVSALKSYSVPSP